MPNQLFQYALTIFLSAFLLFQVQPLAGKYILPWFGGSPSVWTTCLLFFQVLLLGGYAYAHWVASWKRQHYQSFVHLLLLSCTVFLLPIVPSETYKPVGDELPTWRIIGLLTITLGGPYFVLSTTGPLLQAWFRNMQLGRSPYGLYAVSNAGSLLGLLTYPFIFEPLLTRQTQALIWSVAYGAFALGCTWCAWQVTRRVRSLLPSNIPNTVFPRKATPAISNLGLEGHESTHSSAHQSDANDPLDEQPRDMAVHDGLATGCNALDDLRQRETNLPSPGAVNIVRWVIMAACGSVLLLATTNQMCQDVPVIPFLWVLPLSLYLLTFIIAFQGTHWYRRIWGFPLLVFTSLAACGILHVGLEVSLRVRVLLYSLVLFGSCMICHGELERAKPVPGYITLFFLAVAGGGALGGIFVALVAPLLFTGYWEYHLALAGVGFLTLAVLFSDPGSPMYHGKRVWAWTLSLLAYAGLLGALVSAIALERESAASLAASRSFYGVVRVTEWLDEDKGNFRELYHWGVIHGFQYTEGPWRFQPTSYYGKGTGGWLAVNHHSRRVAMKPLRIGVVGLGTGTIAVLGREGDIVRFYEINPEVIRVSRQWFWYLKDTPARTELVLGDARIQLERELSQGRGQEFDVLVVDAFGGNAIPLHLLTRECVHVYRRHLKDDGILAMHISNQNLNLKPVTLGLAEELGWKAILVDSEDDLEQSTWGATWVLITANREFLDSSAVKGALTEWPQGPAAPLLWTDDYTSLFHVLE